MNSFSLMVLMLFATPLLGAFLCLVIRNENTKFISAIAFASSLLTFSFSIVILIFYPGQINGSWSWDWFFIANHPITLSLDFNSTTVSLLLIVTGISFLVNIYSIGFFKNDKSLSRYFSTLSLFTFCMMMLTLSGSLLQLFIFWELVGLCSYLLIGYYRSKPDAASAATQSFIMNKIGDTGFMIALMILWVLGGTFDVQVLETSHVIQEPKIFISFFILIAVFSKSAQFPFHSWLPAAMEGPTPVSALIHSATMVAAGVFVMVRLHFLFVPFTMQLAAIIGAITSLIGGWNAFRESDLKKILAWSTLSQLGLMVMLAGSGGFNASFVHLLSHAIFKSGLFLVIGIIILNRVNQKDNNLISSQQGTLDGSLPLSLKIFFFILCLSLIGFPLTIGFLSKEILLANLNTPIFIGLFFLINLFTIFYTARLWWLTFPSSFKEVGSINSFLLIPSAILAIACLWIFYSWSPISIPWISETWEVLSPSSALTWASVAWVLVGTASAVVIVHGGRINFLQQVSLNISHDRVLQFLFVKPILSLASVSEKIDRKIIDRGIHAVGYLGFGFALLIGWFDKNIMDGLANLMAWLSKSVGNLLRQFVSGKIQNYIWWTLLVIMILVLFGR